MFTVLRHTGYRIEQESWQTIQSLIRELLSGIVDFVARLQLLT